MIFPLLKKSLRIFPLLWGISTIVFFLIHLIPGDPIDILLGESALPAQRESMRKSLNLDAPLSQQYLTFWQNILRGKLGESISHKRPVSVLIAERMPATYQLSLLALLITSFLAIPLGIFLAYKNQSWIDRLGFYISIFVSSIPIFWLGPILILLFSVHFGLLPVSSNDSLASYILPILCLVCSLSGILIRLTRNGCLEVLGQNFITTAHAKGLAPRMVFSKHVLKNALLPVISVIGLQLGSLLGGTVIVEHIFDWPGLGDLLVNAIQSRDYPLIQGCVLVISASYVIINLLTDFIYIWANPRIKI